MASKKPRVQTAKMLEGAIRSGIRLIWWRSLARDNALNQAKRSKGVYLCNSCLRLFNSNEIEVDHVNPVVHYNETFADLTISQLVTRYFQSDLQVLCKSCHKEKTDKEKKMKSEYIKSRKHDAKIG